VGGVPAPLLLWDALALPPSAPPLLNWPRPATPAACMSVCLSVCPSVCLAGWLAACRLSFGPSLFEFEAEVRIDWAGDPGPGWPPPVCMPWAYFCLQFDRE
jgi:hypothetical protein